MAGENLITEHYRAELQAFDFGFEMSDDASVWRAGFNQLKDLHQRQAEIDPNGAIWLQVVDARGLRHAPSPRVGVFAS